MGLLIAWQLQGESVLIPDRCGFLRIVLEGLAGHEGSTVSGEKHPILPIMRAGDDRHEARGAHGPVHHAGFTVAPASRLVDDFRFRDRIVAHHGTVKPAGERWQVLGKLYRELPNIISGIPVLTRIEPEHELDVMGG